VRCARKVKKSRRYPPDHHSKGPGQACWPVPEPGATTDQEGEDDDRGARDDQEQSPPTDDGLEERARGRSDRHNARHCPEQPAKRPSPFPKFEEVAEEGEGDGDDRRWRRWR
jgi:hypothetical protein